MASLVYDIGSYSLQNGSVAFATDTIIGILVASTYTPAQADTHTQITAAEISGITGYTGGWGGSGRVTLGTKTLTNDTTNNRTTYGAANPAAWTLGTGATIGGIVIAKNGAADDTTMIPLFFCACTATPTNGGTFTLTFSANGIAYTQQ